MKCWGWLCLGKSMLGLQAGICKTGLDSAEDTADHCRKFDRSDLGDTVDNHAFGNLVAGTFPEWDFDIGLGYGHKTAGTRKNLVRSTLDVDALSA